jgi:hypothetical protein
MQIGIVGEDAFNKYDLIQKFKNIMYIIWE